MINSIIKKEPVKKPSVVSTYVFLFKVFNILIAGVISEKNDAAIIIPPLTPNVRVMKFLFGFLMKSTTDAPNKVIKYVKKVATRAKNI